MIRNVKFIGSMQNTEKKCLAIFDFDKTITKKDSYNDFFITQFGIIRFIIFIMRNSFFFFLYILGFIKNNSIKEKILTYYFKGTSFIDFKEKCKEYSKNSLPRIMNMECIKKIMWHKKMNHELVLLSASLFEWIEPWAESIGFSHIICTKIEVVDGIVTGKIRYEDNCYGKNKLIFLKNIFNDLKSYYIFAYGDSKSDKCFLEIADEVFYRRFN